MGYLLELIAISREYLGLGNKAHIGSVLLDHRKVPSVSRLKLLHHAVHLLVNINIGWSRLHIIVNMLGILELHRKHITTDILQRDISLEVIP